MKPRITLVMALLILASPLNAQAPDINGGILKVSGTAVAAVPPDRSTIHVEIETAGTSAAEASVANTAKVDRVLAGLAALGPFELETSARAVGPVYTDHLSRDLVDFRATALVTVTVRQLSQIGEVIDAVLATGATGIRQVVHETDNLDSLRLAVLADAVRTARADAQGAAAALGADLGPLSDLEIRDSYPGWEHGMIDFYSPTGQPNRRPEVRVAITVVTRWRLLPE